MLAKRFFYVSAAILMLALSYHLGARGAGAQASGRVLPHVGDGGVVTSNGDIYTRQNNVWGYRGTIAFTPSPIVGYGGYRTLGGGAPTIYRVYCENGDVYDSRPGGGSVFVENIYRK